MSCCFGWTSCTATRLCGLIGLAESITRES
jgi:hypothetical protein